MNSRTTSAHRFAAPLALALLIAVAALVFGAGQHAIGGADPNAVAAAWSRVREAGSYRFAGDVTQVSTPSSTLANVGRASQSDQLHLEGQVSLADDLAEMQLWAQNGTVAQRDDSLGVRVQGGKTSVREGGGAWQERAGFAEGFAPQGDVMAYLAAARDIVAHAPETRAGATFTRLTFRIDGPAFATYMRDQMEGALRRKQAVPGGLQFSAPAYYQNMAGDGELWVDQNGLPLRQLLTLRFPEQNGEAVSAQVSITFSNFGRPGAAAGIVAALRSYLPDPSAPLALLLVLALACLVVRYRHAGRVRTTIAVALIVSLLAGPLLHSLKIRGFLDAQAAQAAAQEHARATEAKAREVQAAVTAPTFDPHASPLAHTPSNALAFTDNGTDTDSDGLTDYQEERIGTDPTFADSDEDGVPDGVEAKGVQFGGKTWYLNPNNVDSNGDGIPDGQEWDLNNDNQPDDTDADGTPDAFDNDNDNDGVPDAKDLAPFTRVAQTYTNGSPFALTVNNLVAGKPTYVDFQLRPTDEKRLWFAFNLLDWPFDGNGQVRDIDGKTYADVARAQGRAAGANEAFGDMKLIPMLEIRVPNGGTNLPPQRDLAPYNITVNNYTADGATKIAYVPLSLVTDEKTGQRVAFSGRMRYLPTGSWPSPQQVRLAWVVQALVDVRCDPKAANAAQQGCDSSGYIRNTPQVIQTYYDDWNLTGLNVKEDNGASMAIAYEDPAVDTNLKDDTALTALSAGLDNAFLSGRDADNNGQRDVDLGEVVRRFNRTTNGAVSDDERWAIPNTLRVERQDYTTFDQSLSSTTMTETVRILNGQFAPRWAADKAIKPLLLFAQEARSRALGIDGIKAGGGYVVFSGNALTLDLSPPGQERTPLVVMNRIQWTPYCAPDGATPAWASCDADAWWAELERRSPDTAVLPGDDPNDTSLAAGRVMVMNIYATQLINGLSRVVQQDNKLVSAAYTLKSDPQYAGIVRTILVSGVTAAVKKIANTVIMARFVNEVTVLKELGNTLKAMRGGTVGTILKSIGNIFLDFKQNRLAGTLIVAAAVLAITALALIVGFNFLTDNLAGKISFKILTIGISTYLSVISPILTLKEWAGTLKAAGSTASIFKLSSEVTGATKAAGIIGTVISVAITWGFFIYSMVANKVSAFSPTFNRALAETVASTIYIVLLFVLSATVVGAILVGIIGVIDAILTAVCELGVDALRTVPGLGGSCFTLGNAAIKGLAYSLYNYSPMINTSRADLLTIASPDVTLADPSKGLAAGNTLTVAMPVVTTIIHKDPDPKDGLLIYPYMWLYSADNLRTSTFKYSLTSGSDQTLSASRKQMTAEWQDVREDHRYLASPMYRGQATANPVPQVAGIALNAGINQKIPLTLNMGYAIPAYECWGVLILGACYTRELADSSSNALDPLVLDVFPPTLDAFLALSPRGDGGQGQTWLMAYSAPAIKDVDGDGLKNRLAGGVDPDDAKPDADNDGLADSYELDRRTRGALYNPALCDTDGDNLTDGQEAQLGTDPASADSDHDSISDADEVWHQRYNTATCQPTTTWEGGWDVIVNGASPLTVHVSSNPLAADSDNDGISDAAERQLAGNADPAIRQDSQNRPYNPNVFNTPPIAVYTAIDDADGIVGLGQTFAYTTTAVTGVALKPSPLYVTLPQGLGNTVQNYTLGFNPATFTTAQTVTQQSAITVAANASSSTPTIVSEVDGQPADNSGAITAIGSLSVVIDGGLPTSSITSLSNDQYIKGSLIGGPTTLIIGGTASDTRSGITKVEVRVNNGPWQLADGRATWTFPLVVDDGVFLVQTRATDGAGNVETPGAGIRVRADGVGPRINFLNTPAAPVIPLRTTSGQWSVGVGGFIDDPQIGLFGSGLPGEIHPGSGIVPASVEVRVRRDGDEASINPWQPVTINGGQWSATYVFPASVADPTGSYRVEMRASDVVGFETQTDTPLILDATAPTPALSAGDSVRRVISDTITLSGVISDANSLVGIDSLEASFAPIDQTVPLADAVLRLPFDEAAGSVYYEDSSGHGNDAVCDLALACPTAGGAGRVDQALLFNGGLPLDVADALSLNFDAQKSFSVQGWINTNQADIVFLRKGRGQQNYQLAIAGGKASFVLQDGAAQSPLTGGPDLNDNKWHFIVGTVDRASGQATLYVDGALAGSKAASGSFANTDPLQLGGQTQVIGAPPQTMFGLLDEIAVYAHALSAAEVRALYAAADRSWLPAALAGRGAGVNTTTWTPPIPAGLEGEYQLDLRAKDMLGNRAVTPKAWRGVVDTLAPRVVLTANPTGAVYFDTASNGYRAAVNYVCGAQDRYLSDANFSCPGTSLAPTRSFDSDPIVQGLFPDLTIRSGLVISYTVWEPVGQISRTARACDLNGHCAEGSAQFTLAPPSGGAPLAVVVSPADKSYVASTDAVSVVVAAEAGQPLKEVTLSLDGTVVDTATFEQAQAVTRNQRTVSVTASGEGAHMLVARATDWTGRVQATLIPITFILDAQAPAVTLDDSPLTVADTYGLGSDVLRFNGTASDSIGLASVQISVNGKPFVDATFGNGTWHTALPVTDPEGKVLSVVVRATDLAGRVTEVNRSVAVDLSTPNPPDTAITSSPTNPAFTDAASFGFTGTPGERGIAGYECQLDDGAFVPCAGGTASYNALAKGAHTFKVRAIDSAGYVDPSPATFTWTITDAPPVTPTPVTPPPDARKTVYLPIVRR